MEDFPPDMCCDSQQGAALQADVLLFIKQPAVEVSTARNEEELLLAPAPSIRF